MKAAYGYFEHDADMGIIGGGAASEQAFVGAAAARTFFPGNADRNVF